MNNPSHVWQQWLSTMVNSLAHGDQMGSSTMHALANKHYNRGHSNKLSSRSLSLAVWCAMTEPYKEEPVSKKTWVDSGEDAVRVVQVEELEASLLGAVENAAKDNCGKQWVYASQGIFPWDEQGRWSSLLTVISRIVKYT